MRSIRSMTAAGVLAATSLLGAAALADEPGSAAGSAGSVAQAPVGRAAVAALRLDVRGITSSLAPSGTSAFGSGGLFDALSGSPTFSGGGLFGTGSGSIGGWESLGSSGGFLGP